ncbi:hypothetical protein GCM10009812_31110 [Nocardioides marinus]
MRTLSGWGMVPRSVRYGIVNMQRDRCGTPTLSERELETVRVDRGRPPIPYRVAPRAHPVPGRSTSGSAFGGRRDIPRARRGRRQGPMVVRRAGTRHGRLKPGSDS